MKRKAGHLEGPEAGADDPRPPAPVYADVVETDAGVIRDVRAKALQLVFGRDDNSHRTESHLKREALPGPQVRRCTTGCMFGGVSRGALPRVVTCGLRGVGGGTGWVTAVVRPAGGWACARSAPLRAARKPPPRASAL
jgi:hypothetical protein